MSFLNTIIEPLSYAFMQKAFFVVILAGINCACVGTYLVLRRMSFMGEALSHTILPGVVFAYLKDIPAFIGALVASLFTALGISCVLSKRNIREDSAIGIILSFMFALGIAMMSLTQSFRDFGHILFGNILSVENSDIGLMCICFLLVISALFFLYKELELSSFDPDYSKLIGIQPNRLRTLLLIMIALSVVSAVKTIGTLLTTALLIIPPTTACLWVHTLPRIILLSSILAIFSGLLGMYISFYLEIASGASIVLCACFFFFLSTAYHHFYKKTHKTCKKD